MCPMFEGVPAIFYSGLWTQQVYGKLDKLFADKKVNIVVFITDFPPAVQIKIENGQFEIIPLEDVKVPEDLDDIECDGYVAAILDILYGGAGVILKGIEDKKVRIKNLKVLMTLVTIVGVF